MYVFIIGRHTQVEESSRDVVSRMKAVETTNVTGEQRAVK